jgi:hypothetical protein
MITLHCQHRDERGKKCGCVVAAIINGVLMIYSQLHNGEKHPPTPIIYSQIVEHAAKEKQRRDQPLRIS